MAAVPEGQRQARETAQDFISQRIGLRERFEAYIRKEPIFSTLQGLTLDADVIQAGSGVGINDGLRATTVE